MLWALTRPGNIALIGVGLFFALNHGPLWLQLMFWFVAGARVVSLMNKPGVEEGVRLRNEKRARGLDHKNLSDGERREMLALDDYRSELAAAGADPSIADGVVEEGWQIIAARTGGAGSSESALSEFRQGLPPIDVERARSDPRESVAERVREELRILKATHAELDASASS